MNPRAQYAADLEQYLKLMDELNNSIMHPNRRAVLETCAEAMQVVLEMTKTDNLR